MVRTAFRSQLGKTSWQLAKKPNMCSSSKFPRDVLGGYTRGSNLETAMLTVCRVNDED